MFIKAGACGVKQRLFVRLLFVHLLHVLNGYNIIVLFFKDLVKIQSSRLPLTVY